ncbi:MAG TPA: hypothetical protein VK991_12000 [Halomonas sp.]|nr:hypothetical protein [Halomonas sp.]
MKSPLRILLLALLAAGITLAVIYRDRFDVAALEAWIGEAGAVAPLVFMALYALAPCDMSFAEQSHSPKA